MDGLRCRVRDLGVMICVLGWFVGFSELVLRSSLDVGVGFDLIFDIHD